MKLIVKPRWLSFFPLIITPVMGEMVVNGKGLPTPWPIGVIGILISIVGILTHKNKRDVLSKIAGLGLLITLIRSLIPLIENFHHLHVQGHDDLQYPFLAFFTALSLLPAWDCLYNSWGKLISHSSESEREEQREYELTEMGEREEESTLENSNRIRSGLTITTPVFVSLRIFFLFLITFSGVWQIVVTSSYKEYTYFNEKTFTYEHNATFTNSQFITQCSEMPIAVSETSIFCTPNDNGFSCLLGFKKIFDFEHKTRVIGPLVLGFYVLLLFATRGHICFGICCLCRLRWCSFLPNEFPFGPNCGRLALLTIATLSTCYLVFTTMNQFNGLNVSNLEGICDINPALLSSKTGYLQEWWEDKLNTARHIALL